MFRRTVLLLMLTLSLVTSPAWARGGYFHDVSTLTLSSHYLRSEAGSDGSAGAGYRHGFLGLVGLCALADLEYRFNRAALDTKLGVDVWLTYFGIRADLLIRQYVHDERTRVGASIGGEYIYSRSTIVYAGANILPGDVTEGVVGLSWMLETL